MHSLQEFKVNELILEHKTHYLIDLLSCMFISEYYEMGKKSYLFTVKHVFLMFPLCMVLTGFNRFICH